MKIRPRDVAAAFTLIDVVGNANEFKARLKTLVETQKATSDAIAEQKRIQAINETRTQLLETGERKQAQVLDGLEQREARLKDAESQHQFRIQSDSDDWVRTRKQHERLVADAVKERDTRQKELDAKAADLADVQQRLSAQAQDLVERVKDLEVREKALKTAQIEYAQRMAKLRELSA